MSLFWITPITIILCSIMIIISLGGMAAVGRMIGTLVGGLVLFLFIIVASGGPKP